MPFELDPSASLEGESLFDQIPQAQVEQAIDMLNERSRDLGISFENKGRKFNTRRAHLAGYYAKDQGLYENFSQKIFEAYFQKVLNIGNPSILSQIAEEVGLDSKEMNEKIDSGVYNQRLLNDFAIANENQINLVPSFIAQRRGNMIAFSGGIPYEDFKEYMLDI